MLQNLKQKIQDSEILRDERFVAALVIFILIVPIPYEGHTTIVESKSGELKVNRDYYTTTVGEMIYGLATSSYEEIVTEEVDERLRTGEDCDVPERFSISFGDLEYYPGNETARLEINGTENVTSENLENLSMHGIGGDPYNTGPPTIRANGRTSETGLIASTENDSRTAIGDFPVRPMNITILEVDGDDDGDGYPGLEPGEQMHLQYHLQYVAIEDYCRHSHSLSLFDIKDDTPEVKWKSWPPYTEGHLWKYDNISDEDLKEMTREEKEELAYNQ